MSTTSFIIEIIDVPQQGAHRRKVIVDPADVDYVCETNNPLVCGMRAFGMDIVFAAQFDEVAKAMHEFRSGRMDGMFKFTIPTANFVMPDLMLNAKVN